MERKPERKEPESQSGPEMTAADLARRAGVHFTYVARLCQYGELPARKLGNYWLIESAVAEAWLVDRELRLAERKRRGELRRLARALPQLKLPGIAPEPEPEPEPET